MMVARVAMVVLARVASNSGSNGGNGGNGGKSSNNGNKGIKGDNGIKGSNGSNGSKCSKYSMLVVVYAGMGTTLTINQKHQLSFPTGILCICGLLETLYAVMWWCCVTVRTMSYVILCKKPHVNGLKRRSAVYGN